jgi:threonine aldolase
MDRARLRPAPRVFETDCEVFFVFNGTAANSLALASLCQSYHSVICHDYAHVETDECGAPEFFSNGTKILVATGPNGKLDPARRSSASSSSGPTSISRSRACSRSPSPPNGARSTRSTS